MREGEEESLDGDFMDFTRLRFPGEIETRARGDCRSQRAACRRCFRGYARGSFLLIFSGMVLMSEG